MDRLENIAIEDIKSRIRKIDKDVISRLDGADLDTVTKAYDIVKNTPNKKKIPTTIPISKVGGVKGDCGSILKQHYINISSESSEDVGTFVLQGRDNSIRVSADSSVIFGVKAILLTGCCRNKTIADECNSLVLATLKLFQKGEYVTKDTFIRNLERTGNDYRNEIIDALEELLKVGK